MKVTLGTVPNSACVHNIVQYSALPMWEQGWQVRVWEGSRKGVKGQEREKLLSVFCKIHFLGLQRPDREDIRSHFWYLFFGGTKGLGVGSRQPYKAQSSF